MPSPKIRIRGIRTPIPTGYVLGKMSSGAPGDVELIHLNDLAAAVGASGHLGGGSGGGSGLDQLTGDVTAGPGVGSQVATLATVNLDVGSFTNANITVNGKGLVTAAANGSSGGIAPNGMLPLVTGDLPPGLYAIGTPDGQMIGVPL